MRRITIVAAALVGAGLCLPVAFARPPRPVRLVPPIDAAQSEPAPPALPSLQSTPAETTWFGGTHWDPGDQRWEANRGGVWTFESGVGSAINTDPLKKPVGYHSLLEGWTSREGYPFEADGEWQSFRRRRATEFPAAQVCVGSAAPPLEGQWSLWAGLTEAEADSACFLAGQGYGLWWHARVAHDFAYLPANIVLSFDYRSEMDSGYSSVTLSIYSDSLQFYPANDAWIGGGVSSGHVTLTLRPGVELPAVPGPLRVELIVSTGDENDQNGIYPTTCGAFGIDNIRLTGGINSFADFEADDGGWRRPTGVDYPQNADYADIRAVSSLYPEPSAAACALGDSLLTFIAPGQPRGHSHPCNQTNLIYSPWIDLAEAGIGVNSAIVFQAGGAYDMNYPYLFLRLGARSDPDTCQSPRLDKTPQMTWASTYYRFTSQCNTIPGRWTRSMNDLVPRQAHRFRLGIGLWNMAVNFFCDVPDFPNSTPWLDDIRVGVVHPATSGVGPGPTTAAPTGVTALSPNPWSGGTPLVIRYRTMEGAAEPAQFDILDVVGRVVRSFEAAGTRGAEGETRWDGRDGAGRLVAGGIYFVRLGRGGSASSRKLVVSR